MADAFVHLSNGTPQGQQLNATHRIERECVLIVHLQQNQEKREETSCSLANQIKCSDAVCAVCQTGRRA